MTEDITPKDNSPEVEMISFQSSRFGELEVPKDSIIEFPKGIIGFAEHSKYVMLDYTPPFSWLHCIEASNLAFVVIDGSALGTEYDPTSAMLEAACDFQTEDEYAILLIVTIRSEANESTVNLKAPIFVNIRNRKAVQVIYDNQKYQTRFPLMSHLEQNSESSS
jgi:flagellar assembly factor FliW